MNTKSKIRKIFIDVEVLRSLKINDNALVVDENGNVGVGTATPSTKIDVSGDLQCSNIFIASDKIIKKNIRTIDSGIDIIKKIKPVVFNYTEDYSNKINKNSNVKHYGFIADEIYNIVPDLVSTKLDNIKSVNYLGIISFLVKSIQELNEKIISLEMEMKNPE